MSFNPFINGGGGTSSEDKVARAEIAAIKDGETLDSFSDVETALADKADITDIPTVPITAIQKNGTDIVPVSGTVNITVPTQASDINAATATQGGKADTAIQGIKVNNATINPDTNKVVNITVPTTAADVSALPDTTKYAAALSLTINSSTYVMTGQLKDQNGDNLGTAQTIDLPLESVVVGGSYDSQTKKVVLTLQNGNTIEFSVADLVSGLQTELSASNKLNPAYINYDSTHRAVSDTEKSTWNSKQNALTTAQLAAVNSGINSEKVEQIETNKNNILSIDEELSEVTESGNLVLGKIEHANVSPSGVIVAEDNCDLWYARVEQGQTYAITTDESTIILGYYDELPYSGLRSYDSQRIITEVGVYTVTAPITGYVAFRSLTGYEYAQIEKGTTRTPYKDYRITAVDYMARSKIAGNEADIETMENEIAGIEGDIDILNRKIIDTSGTLYDGLNESDTYSFYSHVSKYYSICFATAGTTINKISVLADEGVSGIKLLLFYKSGNEYYLENLISLSDGTGHFVENIINYTLTHDCALALNAFGFARASSGDIPKIISNVGPTTPPGTELSSVEDGTDPLDYTCKITASSQSELSKLGKQIEILSDPSTVASDIAMFENVGFCGDSYMAGMVVVSENPTVTALNQNLCWGKILERTHGINASIFAKGGVKASDYISDTDCLPALLEASAQQLYVISLGHNDAYNRTSVSSFKTSYESILDSIIEHAPNAKIILCRQSRGYGDLNNGPELNEAISEIGEDYGLPVLDPEDDIYLASSIYTSTQVHRHPTFAGYAGMAKAFDRQFAKATVDYANYFKDYTGLPTE